MKRLFLILVTIASLTCFAPGNHKRSKSSVHLIAPTKAPNNTPVDSPNAIPQSHSSEALNKIQATHEFARVGELQARMRERDTASHGDNSFVTISLSSKSHSACTTPDHIREFMRAQDTEQTVRLQKHESCSSEESTTTEPLSPEQEEELLKTLEMHGRILNEKSQHTTRFSTSIDHLLAARSRNKSPIPIREEARNFSADS